MISRIQKIIQLKKLTSSAFADKIGVPRSTISHIISGRNNPSLEFVQKILDNFPEIRTEWLVRGEGHMLKASNTLFPDEDNDVANSVSLKKSDEVQENVLRKDFSKKTITESTPPLQSHISGQQERKNDLKDSNEVKKMDIIPDDTVAMSMKENKKEEKSDKNMNSTVRVLMFYHDGSFSEHFPVK